MILNTTKLRHAIKASGLSQEDLAAAVDRQGLKPRAAIRNWTTGRHEPKPTAPDLANLASALGVEVRDIVHFDATHRWARIAPRKARLVADLIRGKDVDSALSLLRFNKKRAAVFFRHVLDSALASAEENDADVTSLVVSVSRVDEGPTIKRFRPKDRGRAHRINKRTSHIIVAVEEAA